MIRFSYFNSFFFICLFISLQPTLAFLCFTPKLQSLHRNQIYSRNLKPLNSYFNDHQRISILLSQSLTDTSNVESTDVIEFTENTSVSLFSRIFKRFNLLYKFSRPHTIKGTILASFMGVTRALVENPGKLSLELLPRALIGLVALLCGNAYIVGINQIYDVKIDEINKPYLPIAAKSISPKIAWQIVLGCLITGVSIVKSLFSPIIFQLYLLGVVLGTSYSVPPIQLKRIPIFASSIIAFVRGFLLNFGVYYAVREALHVKFSWNPVVAFISSFMTVFASVIAITKDLSDVEGDVKYNIKTFASKYGVKNIATAASSLLGLAYFTAISIPWLVPNRFKTLPMVLGHSALLGYLIKITTDLDSTNSSSIRKYYKSIWNLFYLEYCLYPFI